jgi:hypothetical protein
MEAIGRLGDDHTANCRAPGKMKLLSKDQIEQFIERGYVRLDQAFPRDLVDRGREILWKDTGCDPANPSTWTKPVVWLQDYDQEPFRQAVNTPNLSLVKKKASTGEKSFDITSPLW